MRNSNEDPDADIERLARETGVLRFQATCANPGCGTPVPADQVMCSACAMK